MKENGSCYLCGEEAFDESSESSFKCSQCDIVACSPQCLEIHYDQNGQCLPFKMDQNDQLGRFLVATKPIKTLEIVLKDPPLIMAPQSLPVCLVCLSEYHI